MNGSTFLPSAVTMNGTRKTVKVKNTDTGGFRWERSRVPRELRRQDHLRVERPRRDDLKLRSSHAVRKIGIEKGLESSRATEDLR